MLSTFSLVSMNMDILAWHPKVDMLETLQGISWNSPDIQSLLTEDLGDLFWDTVLWSIEFADESFRKPQVGFPGFSLAASG